MALRLAWYFTPKYPTFADAVWSRCETGMGWEAVGSGQAHEEEMGRRLG